MVAGNGSILAWVCKRPEKNWIAEEVLVLGLYGRECCRVNAASSDSSDGWVTPHRVGTDCASTFLAKI